MRLDAKALGVLNDPMLIRPLVVTRFANSMPGAAVIVIGLALVINTSVQVPPLIGGAVTAVGVVLAVRGFRTGARLNRTSVTVRGYLWSRTIPRRAITELTTLPALRWTSRSGASRWTPLFIVYDLGRALAFINAHHERCQALLREGLASSRSA
jgi:hypothetical protein